MLFPLIAAVILSLAYFFSELYFPHLRKASVEIISFSSGLFISFIFLTIFPQIIVGFGILGENILLISMWGFIIFHILEKHVYQHVKNPRKKAKQIDTIRTAGFFINHFILGFALVFFFKMGGTTSGIFFSIPILFHMISSSLLMEVIHKKIHQSVWKKLFASSAIFLGAVVSLLLNVSTILYLALFSFAAGMFLYLIIRDIIPGGAKGKVTYFIFGVMLYFLILFIEKLLGAF